MLSDPSVVVTKTETGEKASTDGAGKDWAPTVPETVAYALANGDDAGPKVKLGHQAKTAGWTEKDPKADEKKKAADKAAADAKEAAAKEPKKEETTTPQTGACGAEDQCDTTVSEVEIKCGAAKLGAGLLASLAIAASL